ncbi:MAG: peroxiredoxin-like family protein [Rhodospirillales bacterium]
MSAKPAAGGTMPNITLKTLDGDEVGTGGNGKWRLLVVYRGKHCPLCKSYLGRLEEVKERFTEQGTEILLASGDPKEKATASRDEWGLTLPLAYDLSVEQMQTLGLYVSEPRSPQETDRPFPEPGLFLVNPDGQLQIVDISNAPFARPDLESIAKGLAFIRDKGYPIRGTLGI